MDLILLQLSDALLTSVMGVGMGELDVSVSSSTLGFDATKCIELVSINQGIQQKVTTDVSNSARTSGRPIISDFTCVKYVDVISPKLYEYCLSAKTLDSPGSPCIIHMLRNSGDRLNLLMQFGLTNVLINEIQFQSHPDDMATEQFKLNFTEISWLHCQQSLGSLNEGHVSTGWSIAANRPITPVLMDSP